MEPVIVRSVTLGVGRPKIAVSITGATAPDILAQAAQLREAPVDVAEWRMDFFEGCADEAALRKTLAALRQALGDMPLLATFRTAQEGGQRPLSAAGYLALNETVIASGCADLLDVELLLEEAVVSPLLQAAHGANLPVVLSNHDFEKTPPVVEMVGRLRRMQEMGGDILKLAVMPQIAADVLALLQATEEMATKYADRPLITMSMGNLGKVTRLCGEAFGSCLTFAAVGEASAPGQMEAEKVAQSIGLLAL
jgi:3-dehydroquinate dehydratase-1